MLGDGLRSEFFEEERFPAACFSQLEIEPYEISESRTTVTSAGCRANALQSRTSSARFAGYQKPLYLTGDHLWLKLTVVS